MDKIAIRHFITVPYYGLGTLTACGLSFISCDTDTQSPQKKVTTQLDGSQTWALQSSPRPIKTRTALSCKNGEIVSAWSHQLHPYSIRIVPELVHRRLRPFQTLHERVTRITCRIGKSFLPEVLIVISCAAHIYVVEHVLI